MVEHQITQQVREKETHLSKPPRPAYSRIKPSTIIRGTLVYTKDKSTRVDSVDIYINGMDPEYGHVGTFKVVDSAEGAEFELEMADLSTVGEYKVIWNMVVSNNPTPIIDRFMIYNDVIDRTLPIELQSQGAKD